MHPQSVSISTKGERRRRQEKEGRDRPQNGEPSEDEAHAQSNGGLETKQNLSASEPIDAERKDRGRTPMIAPILTLNEGKERKVSSFVLPFFFRFEASSTHICRTSRADHPWLLEEEAFLKEGKWVEKVRGSGSRVRVGREGGTEEEGEGRKGELGERVGCLGKEESNGQVDFLSS